MRTIATIVTPSALITIDRYHNGRFRVLYQGAGAPMLWNYLTMDEAALRVGHVVLFSTQQGQTVEYNHVSAPNEEHV